ncbi:hypothetical protein GCM10027162_77890 [Streptomyces incanus]
MDELADGLLATPEGQDRVELADVLLGPAGLDAGEEVDGPVAENDAVAEVAGWDSSVLCADRP